MYSQTAAHYKIGSGTSEFTLDVGKRGMGTVYALRDPADIANVTVINRVQQRTELLTDGSQFDTSSRVVDAGAGAQSCVATYPGISCGCQFVRYSISARRIVSPGHTVNLGTLICECDQVIGEPDRIGACGVNANRGTPTTTQFLGGNAFLSFGNQTCDGFLVHRLR